MRWLLVVIVLLGLARHAAGDPPAPPARPGEPTPPIAPPPKADPPAATPPAPAPTPPPVQPAKPAEKPLTPEQAADSVLAAVKAKDDAGLKTLAAKDEPDPWLVADELLARTEPDAANAFATASPRKDVDRLPAYVDARRGLPDDAGLREAVGAAESALGSTMWRDALDALAARGGAPTGTVLAVRAALTRGSASKALGRWADAVAAYVAAADAAEGIGWLAGAARALDAAGAAAYAGSSFPAALVAAERRMRIEEQRGHLSDVARSLSNAGVVQRALGNHAKALEAYGKALETAEAIGDLPLVVATLGNLGNVHYALGDYPKALEFQSRALRQAQELGDRAREAATLGNIGTVHFALGNYPKALEFEERALSAKQELGDRAGAATVLGTLGSVHHALGDYPKALDLQERALAMKEGVGDLAGGAVVLGNLGVAHLSLGNFAKALECQQKALDTLERLGVLPGVARALDNIGNVHYAEGDFTAALEFFEKALAKKVETGDRAGEAATLGNIGSAHSELGDQAKAIEYAQRALKVEESIGDRAGAARTFCALGVALRRNGDLAGAAKSLDRAVREAERIHSDPLLAWGLWEQARTELEAKDFGRAVLNAKRATSLLDRMVGGLAETQGAQAREEFADLFSVGALAAARSDATADVAYFLESGRAGEFLDSLGGRQALRWAVVPEALREAEDEARGRESSAASEYRSAVDAGDRAVIQARSATLVAAREGVVEAIERIQREAKKSPGVVYPRAATVEEIQESLAPNEALVLYGFCLDEALALVACPKVARVVSLGSAADVRAACDASDFSTIGGDPGAAIAALRKVLIEPLHLETSTRRVLVSPEGPLSYVPFGALLPDLDVACVPSGTTYGTLKAEGGANGTRVLALGDPDYGAKVDPKALELFGRGRAGRLSRLPATREEANGIGDVVLLGAEASEAGLASALAGTKDRWRAVHFACHGLVDPERPTLSSLALTPDPKNDGFLTALEVFRMEIPADLVVLSACETAKGRVVRGEGIVGLTRAFMFAGAPRVICSLWKVDDEATRALMVKFYSRWNPKDGSKPMGTAAALKAAQEYIRSQPKWAHPYYWAAWVLWGIPG